LINQLVERSGSILVFVKTKHGADKIVKRLKYDGHSAEAIHGNLRQSKRERVINNFRNGKSRILIATDVAARGLDIPLIQHVINYDLPQVPEDYIHRIGRTGRAGKEGSALTFLTPSDRSMWNSITRLVDPNFKISQDGQSRNSKSKKRFKARFNKEKKFFKKNDTRKSSFKDRKKFFKKDDTRKSSFKDKKKFFKKDDSSGSRFKKKKIPFGSTNNPKYFGRETSNNSQIDSEKKDFKFNRKKKFKNRKRPKNFSFKKHKQSR